MISSVGCSVTGSEELYQLISGLEQMKLVEQSEKIDQKASSHSFLSLLHLQCPTQLKVFSHNSATPVAVKATSLVAPTKKIDLPLRASAPTLNATTLLESLCASKAESKCKFSTDQSLYTHIRFIDLVILAA